MIPIALTIAGSDSGGGAGIQADLKTFSALGVYGASVVTAVTAQNTRAVKMVEPASPAMIAAQMEALRDDLRIDAIKLGMLGDGAAIAAVARGLDGCTAPIVLDPVMVSKSGAALLHDDAVAALCAQLLARCDLLTPNLPEAARLLGSAPARSADEMEQQGQAMRALGAPAVLMKGGHADGDICVDLLIDAAGTLRMQATRRATRNTHGTGCTLSAAIAAELAKGHPLRAAVQAAHRYLQGAIAAADDLKIGKDSACGHGPVHHFHAVWRDA